MLSFNHYSLLTELFNKVLNFKIIHFKPEKIVYEFLTDKNQYVLVTFTVPDKSKPDHYYLEFTVDFVIERTQKNIGEEFTIFSTVIRIVSDFLEQVSPEQLVFSAAKFSNMENRIELYRNIIKKLMKDIEKMGYLTTEKHEGNKTIFYFNKKSNSKEVKNQGA